MQAWEAHDPTLTRPIAAPLERCAELLGVDLGVVAVAVVQEDVNLARVELQRLGVESAQLESDLVARELSLKLRMGMAPEAKISLEGNVEALAAKFRPEKYQTTMVVNRPDLRQTELGIDRAAAEAILAST